MMTRRPTLPFGAAMPRFSLFFQAILLLLIVYVQAFTQRSPYATASERTSSPSPSALFADATQTPTSTRRRQPWNVFRFVQQSSKFVSVLPQKKTSSKPIKPGDVVWEQAPNTDRNAKNSVDFTFAPLDDVVMGGASSSTVTSWGGWIGSVTDANNGGFVGIRSTPYFQYNLDQCRGLELTVRTRSKAKRRYKLGLRDSKEFNGIVWNASFLVNGSNRSGSSATTTTVRIPFSKLVPTLFARTVPDAPAFNRQNVVGIQFVYSKFEYDGNLNDTFQVGDVDLELVSIKAY
jgi:hypothetical protein